MSGSSKYGRILLAFALLKGCLCILTAERVKAVLTVYVAKANTVGFSKRLDDKMKASSLHSKQGLFAP